jgi:hypothetical protein
MAEARHLGPAIGRDSTLSSSTPASSAISNSTRCHQVASSHLRSWWRPRRAVIARSRRAGPGSRSTAAWKARITAGR